MSFTQYAEKVEFIRNFPLVFALNFPNAFESERPSIKFKISLYSFSFASCRQLYKSKEEQNDETFPHPLAQVDSGGNVVWGINNAEEVFVRVGLTQDDPKGKEWTKIDGNMKHVRWGSSLSFSQCTFASWDGL